MIAAMEAIKQAFSPQYPFITLLRGIGMSLLNHVSPIKKILIDQALGLRKNLPELATKKRQ